MYGLDVLQRAPGIECDCHRAYLTPTCVQRLARVWRERGAVGVTGSNGGVSGEGASSMVAVGASDGDHLG